MTWQLGALALGVAGTVVPVRRVPPAVVAVAVTLSAMAVGIVSSRSATDALAALDEPLLFLLVAVPLAATLDEVGFFASAAALLGGGRHLRVGLWAMGAAVTMLFNLDAAVVLLTPLYVHLARRHGDDPVALGFMPVLLACLASSALPVSNLTNLIVADPLALDARDFLVRAAPATLAATIVGWFCYRRAVAPPGPRRPVDDRPDRRALLIGAPIVAWLLLGFTLGDGLGLPAWIVAAAALVATVAAARSLPWRTIPIGPALLALALGTLAIAAAGSLHLDRVLAINGRPGEAATLLTAAVGANAVNNLPMTLVLLDPLAAHPDRVWAVLLGVNLGPTLWVTGALSTLLWQSTMRNLGHPISARRYAAVGWRVGVPAIAVALGVRLVAP